MSKTVNPPKTQRPTSTSSTHEGWYLQMTSNNWSRTHEKDTDTTTLAYGVKARRVLGAFGSSESKGPEDKAKKRVLLVPGHRNPPLKGYVLGLLRFGLRDVTATERHLLKRKEGGEIHGERFRGERRGSGVQEQAARV